MNIDRLIAIGALLFGAVGIWLAIYFYRKTIRSKVLAIGYTHATPLMIPVPGVTVSYLGAERKALSRSFLLFWNRGTAAIERGDFVEPIVLKGDIEILLVSFLDKDTMAAASVSEDKRTIQIDLLRPGEAFILQIDAASSEYRPDLSVIMKSPNMSQVIQRFPGALGFFGGGMETILTLIILFGGIVIAFYGFGFDAKTYSGWAVVSALALGIVASVLPVALLPFLRRVMATYISPVPLRFFDIKQNRESVF